MHSVRRRGGQHTFSLAPQANIQRSSFNRSHGHKTTFNEGYLVPVFCDEVLPGDTFNLRMTAFARLATPIFPIMDNMYLDSFFFFVPNRLVWDHWENFNGAQFNPSDSTDFQIPVTTAVSGVATGSLADYFGIPTLINGVTFNVLPLRCYSIIINEWFKDENLQNSLVQYVGDGPDPYTDYIMARRGKRHDYFTSCLPWPQKINDGTIVDIPLGTTAPVITSGLNPTVNAGGLTNAGLAVAAGNAAIQTVGTPGITGPVVWGNQTGLLADLSQASAATINQLRQAFQLQRLYERDARGGTRYTEIIQSHFGVISPDARLQRPEYLGGGQSMVNIAPVAQTAPAQTDDVNQTPKGDLAAFGTVTAHGHGFVKSFTEHGYVIGLISVRADLSYQQGLNRMWSREDRFDFYWPALSHIGEQAVLNKEIYYQGNSADADVFGYQERFAEYRYKPSMITGLFRSNAAQSLDAWHLAQDFGNLPVLGYPFIVEDAPMARIKAVPSQPDFIADIWFDFISARPMPLYGVPGYIDHF